MKRWAVRCGVCLVLAAALSGSTGCDRAVEQGARLGLVNAASTAVSGVLLAAGTALVERFTNVDIQSGG
jgi:hypothetical protein